MMNRVKIKIITGGGFALALLVLVLLGWLAYRDMYEATFAAKEVDHTYTVLRKLDRVFSDLKDAEAGQRGYIITGREEYLKPYYTADADIEVILSELKNATANNSRLQPGLETIGALTARKLSLLQQTIETRRTRGYGAAMQSVETGIGEKLMNDIRAMVEKTRAEETSLLQARSAARRAAAQRLIGAIIAGGTLGLALLMTAYILLRNEISRRIRVEEELRKHQDGLEDLVKERTRDIAVANTLLKKEIEMRRRAEEDLKKSLDDLARSNQELDQFASVASHDLQSPLRAVSGFVNLLANRYSGKFDSKADEYIAFTLNGVKRMSLLISDLYTYSRVGTRGKQLVPLALGKALEGATENLKTAIDENAAVIASDELPVVEGDPIQLVQLFQNLLGNAIKFRRKDIPPRIRISAERTGNFWQFGVHDNGIGVEPRFFEKIFAIFERLHTTEEYPGTGMGLALCKKIVVRHGGRIWIDSRPGEGSSFYFTMPAAPSGGNSAPAEREGEGQKKLQRQ